ncbi:MAG: hypothetical protein V6Z89_24525 [Desulfobacter sp.]
MQIETTPIPTTIALKGSPLIKGKRLDTRVVTAEPTTQGTPGPSFLPDQPKLQISQYQNQLREQGTQEQSMVISKRNQVAGAIGRDGSAMFQDSSIGQLWQEAGNDPEVFAGLLKKEGYEVKTYSPGSGPTYAEIHQQIHGEPYATLVERQTAEYYREMLANSGHSTLFEIRL